MSKYYFIAATGALLFLHLLYKHTLLHILAFAAAGLFAASFLLASRHRPLKASLSVLPLLIVPAFLAILPVVGATPKGGFPLVALFLWGYFFYWVLKRAQED